MNKLYLAISVGLLTVTASPSFAQSSGDDVLEEVIVTGSRVPRGNLESNSPLVILDGALFQVDADTNIVRQLNMQPAFQPGRSPGFGGGSSFVGSFADLRGLDRKRTLVLVNGRRWVNTISDGGVDLSTIPPELVARIEVVTGGASATYGSDAIAGVVNVILKDDIEGIETNAVTSFTGEGDSVNTRISLTGGTPFSDGRGSSFFHASWDKLEAITGAGYPSLNPAVFNDAGVFVPNNSNVVDMGSASVGGDTAVFDSNGELFSAPGVINPLAESDMFNSGQYARLQYPAEKVSFATGLSYEVNDRITFNADALYVREDIQVLSGPRGQSLEDYEISVDNPFIGPLTQGYLTTIDGDADGFVQIPGLSRRLAELGQETRTNDRDSYRIGAGVTIELANDWNLEAFATYANSDFEIGRLNRPHLDRLEQALDVVDGPNGPECRNRNFGTLVCAPLNVFGSSKISPEAAAFINAQGGLKGFNTESDIQFILTGDLFSLPAGDVGVAAGIERRSASGGEAANDIWTSGVTGIALGTFESSLDLTEVFGEAIIPLAQDASMAQYLGLELGARYTTIDHGDDEWTYKALVEWSPIEKLKFRGGIQRAFRAPNFFELGGADQEFDPLVILDGIDHCFTGSPLAGDVRTSCIANGVPVAVADVGATMPPAQEFFFSFFGNPNLSPETADTVTVGVVVEAFDDLVVTVDYYNIEIDDVIDGINETLIFDKCFLSGTSGTDPFCNEITRDPATGLVSSLNAGFHNLGNLSTDGIDFGVTYGTSVGNSELGVEFSGTYLLSYEVTPLAEEPEIVDICDGLYGDVCGSPRPEWRASTRATLDSGSLSYALTWTWIGDVDNDLKVFSPQDLPNLARTGVGAYHYLDFSVLWAVNDTFKIRAGIDNVADESPPIVGIDQGTPESELNTFPGLYDSFGRRFFVGASVNF